MKVMRYKTDKGVRVALLVSEGRKWLKVIIMDSAGIKISRKPLPEKHYMDEMTNSVRKVKKQFRMAGRAFGITKSAKQALRG